MILGQLGFEVFTSWENMLSLSLIGPENMIKWQNCQKKTLLWIQASRPLWMYCKIHTVAYGVNLSKILLLIFLGPWISHTNPWKHHRNTQKPFSQTPWIPTEIPFKATQSRKVSQETPAACQVKHNQMLHKHFCLCFLPFQKPMASLIKT